MQSIKKDGFGFCAFIALNEGKNNGDVGINCLAHCYLFIDPNSTIYRLRFIKSVGAGCGSHW